MHKLWWAMACASACATSAWAQDMSFERPYWIDRSVIEAIGAAQVDVPPDHARFTVTFRAVAGNARDAMFAASDRARLAAEAIRSRGGDAVRITSQSDIEAIYEDYRNREGERVASERNDQIENYAVSVTLSVEVADIARAANVRAAAMAVGPEEATDLTYGLSETAPARLRVYRAAVQDAAARARMAADGTGAALGRLLIVQDGQGPCLGRWQGGAARMRGEAPSGLLQDVPLTVTAVGARGRELTLSAEDIARMQLPQDAPMLQLNAQVCAVYAVAP